MENLKKSLKSYSKFAVANAKVHPLLSQLRDYLNAHLGENKTILLALSGGVDSSVLFHLLNSVKQIVPFKLQALHVHHGLSPHADKWADFCRQQCSLQNVPLTVEKVVVEKNSKLGLEANAREKRYEVLFNHRINDLLPDFIVTAHHQDDQAETLLLQLFRGSGVKGLSSMATKDDGRRLLRPLLEVPQSVLQQYAEEFSVQWCDDESNQNTQFDRNFIRHSLMPVLAQRFPAVKSVLARTTSHLAEANDLLNVLGALDAKILLKDNSLCLTGLAEFNLTRAKNILRWWFSQNLLAMPNTDHLTEIMQQLFNAKPDANLCIKMQYLTIRRYQKRAYLIPDEIIKPFDLVWQGEESLMMPNGGRLIFKLVFGRGLALKFGMEKLRIVSRCGGERFKPCKSRPTRTLKHLLQEVSMPPWTRSHLPLVYWQDTLACVPGIGTASELQAAESEQGLEVTWEAPLA